MRTVVVRTLAELRAAVEAMPRAPGCVRVYRGQTREYPDAGGKPLLLPSLSRRSGSPEYDPAWLGTMMSFVAADAGAFDYESFSVWAPALVQHYGPGSYFLDVSHDLDTALWFASHEYHERWLMLKADEHDIQQGVAWSTDVAHDRRPVIYAFDAEPWDGKGAPRHGQLVDLLALEPTRRLAERAARLKAQTAALLYADPRSEQGANLAPNVSFRIALDASFDIAEIADLKWVEDIYPNPTTDPLYKALVEYPSQMQLEPPRLQQPLTIPFQLTRPLPMEDSPNVIDLGGKGDYVSPKRLKFRLKPGQDLHAVQQLLDYLSLGSHMTPPLFHAWLMQESSAELGLGDDVFHIRDALPLFLEAPLWRFVPDAGAGLGRWIQSALPYGIAETIDGRSTRNVYVEISPLDVLQPGGQASRDLLRGIWVVRSGDQQAVTLYRRSDDAGTYSYTVRFRYDANAGVFKVSDKRASSDTRAKAARAVSLKALFLTLTLLRDLSPGFKPPPTYNLTVGKNKHLPMPLLEGQLASPHRVASGAYVIPKALDGTRYLRASGGPRDSPFVPQDAAVAMRELERFFPLVKADHYRAFAGGQLADLYAAQGRFDAGRTVLEVALKSARRAGVLVQELEQRRERMRRAITPRKGGQHVKTSR